MQPPTDQPVSVTAITATGSIRCEHRRDGYPMIRKPFTKDELFTVMQQTTGTC